MSLLHRPWRAALAAAVAVITSASALAGVTIVEWSGPPEGMMPGDGGDGRWDDECFWASGGMLFCDVPDNIGTGLSILARIDARPGTSSNVELTGPITISGLGIDLDDVLDIDDGGTLTLDGAGVGGTANLLSDGLLMLSDDASGQSILRFTGDLDVDGAGTIGFATAATNRILALDAGGRLTVGNDQTITTVDAAGTGSVECDLDLLGELVADEGTIEVAAVNVLNRTGLRATGGGSLVLAGTVVQSVLPGGGPGRRSLGSAVAIAPEAGSTVVLDGATLFDGMIFGAGTLLIEGASRIETITAANPVALDGGLIVRVPNGSVLDLAAAIDLIRNDAAIHVDDVGTGLAEIRIDGDLMIDGVGTLGFASGGTNLIEPVAGDEVLTLGPEQSIRTVGAGSSGEIRVSVVNAFEIVSTDGGSIEVEGAMLDQVSGLGTGRVLAELGSTADLRNGLVVHGGVLEADGTSEIVLDGATVVGAELRGLGAHRVAPADAILDGQDTPVRIDEDATLLMSGSGLRVEVLGELRNDGLIVIDDTSSSVNEFRLVTDVDLTGIGELRFESDDDNRVVAATGVERLTVGPGQLLTTSAAALVGQSLVSADVLNEGVIEARVGGLTLEMPVLENIGEVRAVEGGTLRLDGVDVHNAGAPLVIEPGALIRANAVTIRGGSIEGGGTLEVESGDLVLDGTEEPVVLDAGTMLDVVSTGRRVTVRGTLLNDGTIRIEDTGSSINELAADGEATLGGSGVVLLTNDDDDRIVGTGTDPRLTIGPLQTIHADATTLVGQARIEVDVLLDGRIETDGGGLTISGVEVENRSTIAALGGGTIELENVTVLNASGRIEAEAGSTVLLDGTTIEGGVLSGGGVHDVTTADVVLDGRVPGGLLVEASATVAADGAGRRITALGDVTNDGVLALRDLGSGFAELLVDGGGEPTTIGGTGTILSRASGDDDTAIEGAVVDDLLRTGPQQTIEIEAGATLRIRTPVEAGGPVEVAGVLRLEDGDLALIDGGVASGDGTIVDDGGTTTNVQGTIAPGDGALGELPGELTIDGHLAQGNDARLAVQLGGFEPGVNHDRLVVSDVATLDGRVAVTFLAGFIPEVGDEFEILSAAAVTGTFDEAVGPANFILDHEADRVILRIVSIPGCTGDLDGSNAVDTPDLIALLAAWGPCEGCLADVTGDGIVDTSDLLTLLAAWGPCDP